MTKQSKKLDKGFQLEEVLRAYFLRSGFYVLRGVPFKVEKEDLTDIDIWLYERPTGSSSRCQIVDAKSKTKPKAVERLLWTKGLADALDMDGAYIATTDTRPTLKEIASKLGVSVLDGNDVKRIQESPKVQMPERHNDEEIIDMIKEVDKSRRSKEFADTYRDIKASVLNNLDASGAVRALGAVSFFANNATVSHPNSDAAKLSVRMTYFATSIAAVCLDAVGLEGAFRTKDERREMFSNAIRFGSTDKDAGLEKVRVASALVRRFADNGAAISNNIEKSFLNQLDNIPSEIIADHIIKMGDQKALFSRAKMFEYASYHKDLPSFDMLDADNKAFLGAVLDFCSVNREDFANAFTVAKKEGAEPHDVVTKMDDLGTLFDFQ